MIKLEDILIHAFGIVGTLNFISTGIGLYGLCDNSPDKLTYNLTSKVIFSLVCGIVSYSIAVY